MSYVESRRGLCYELAYEFVSANPKWTLVHGIVSDPRSAPYGTGKSTSHAWTEQLNMVHDPVLGVTMEKVIYYRLNGISDYAVEAELEDADVPETLKVTYTSREMWQHGLNSGHFGPWDSRIWNHIPTGYSKADNARVRRNVRRADKKGCYVHGHWRSIP